MEEAIDKSMRIRLRRLRMGILSYAMFLLPLVYSVQQGWTAFAYEGLLGYVIVAAGLNLLFYLAIRSGWSLRLRDPSMTLAQIAAAQALALVMVRYGGEARGVLLLLFVAASFFGIFALNTRQMLMLTGATLAGYALFIVLPEVDEPGFRFEILRFLTLAMILVWLSLLGGYVAGLRERLVVSLARLRALASHDELTGLYNRRQLMEILHREQERATRYDTPFAIGILDIDHFKSINDRYGHEVGDEALRQFARRLRGLSRQMDWIARDTEASPEGTFGRLGGEEFLLVLPHAQLPGARACLERIRMAISAEPLPTSAGPLPVSFSAGIAVYRAGEEASDTLRRADAALYRAKRLGRNRIEDEDVEPLPAGATIDRAPLR